MAYMDPMGYVMCGDFNAADVSHSLKCELLHNCTSLHDLTGNLVTYHHGDTHAKLKTGMLTYMFGQLSTLYKLIFR